MAIKVAGELWTRVAETILASVHVRARQQIGHMDASDLIKTLQKHPCEGGRPDAGRRDNANDKSKIEGLKALRLITRPGAGVPLRLPSRKQAAPPGSCSLGCTLTFTG